MSDDDFWVIVRTYNELMKEAIKGPNCIDPSICHADCCSIKIDVPKILAKEYIKKGLATKDDFIRSNIFSFHLRFDEKKGKCFLYDKEINGCSVHTTGIKPPQCWIYPTNFSNVNDEEIKCKRASGWKIVDLEKIKEAEYLLQKFIKFCEKEAKEEFEKINDRIDESKLRKQIQGISPSHLGGFKDTWNNIKILSADGLSLQMKKFCSKYDKDCKILNANFLECISICNDVANELINFLKKNLKNFIEEDELDVDGHYPLYKLIFNY